MKDNYRIECGDSVELITTIESESVGLSVFSPPFPGMYAYSDDPRDIGNSQDLDQLMAHFEFMMPELLRITMPGRSCCIHLAQMPIFKWQEGYTGLRDFRGAVIARMLQHGWVLASERMIDKCPQLKAARTKDSGLAMRTAATDSAKLTGAMPDYLLQFRKKGENPRPIRALIDHDKTNMQNPNGWMTKQEWIWWASAVWWNSKRHTPDGGISETDVLRNFTEGRAEEDEKHLCPLQQGVIERCVKIWSGPDDVVFSPFMGIGSEGYTALKLGRRFIGFELKPSYFVVAKRNCEYAIRERDQTELPLLYNG